MPRALVTGAAGFIGSHLCDYLLREGWDVVGIDDLSTGRPGNLPKHERFEYRTGAVQYEQGKLNSLLRGCDAAFHLASVVGVKRVLDDPGAAVREIVTGAAAMTDCCRLTLTPLLFTSSSEVYGRSEDIPFKEGVPCQIGPSSEPRWAYAAAKLAAEFIVLGVPANKVIRLFNVSGPRQVGNYGMVIPRFVSQALQRERLTVHGDGSQWRCFCSVFEIVEGLCRTMATDKTNGMVMNLGGDQPVTVLELANKVVCAVTKDDDTLPEGEIVKHVPYADVYGGLTDLKKRQPCLERAKALIDWHPTIGIDRIIDHVISDQLGVYDEELE